MSDRFNVMGLRKHVERGDGIKRVAAGAKSFKSRASVAGSHET